MVRVALGLTVKLTLFEGPAVGAGLITVTGTVAAAAMSPAVIAAVSRVLLTKVVVRGAPFHRTAGPGTKPLPSTVNVNAGPPAGALFGESVVTVGTGFVSSSVIVSTAVLGVPSVAPPVAPLSVRLTLSLPSTSPSLR